MAMLVAPVHGMLDLVTGTLWAEGTPAVNCDLLFASCYHMHCKEFTYDSWLLESAAVLQ